VLELEFGGTSVPEFDGLGMTYGRNLMGRLMGRCILLVALGIGVSLGLGGGMAQAQQKPTIQQLLQSDLQGIPGQETILEVLTIPPGGATPRHVHPDGHEIVYVLEGSTTAEIDGRETRSYGVGEVLHVPPNIPHIGRNASKTEPLKVLIIRIKDKSKPVMVPVK
jgi:quercetin dioxygenase-like cupin family protein